MHAGLGRLALTRAMADTLLAMGRGEAGGLLAWPMALGLAPPGYDRGRLDSIVAAVPVGPERDYAAAMLHLIRGRPAEARRAVDAILARRDTTAPELLRGQIIAAEGMRRLAEGLDTAASPGTAAALGLYRFQLALAMASRPATRREDRAAAHPVIEPLFLPSPTRAGRAWKWPAARLAAAAYGRSSV
jgi:hypothetical protein